LFSVYLGISLEAVDSALSSLELSTDLPHLTNSFLTTEPHPHPSTTIDQFPTLYTTHKFPSSHRLTPPPPAECAKSAQCAPAKHHYDACAERVRSQHENKEHKGPKEDCVEECEYISPYSLIWRGRRRKIRVLIRSLVFHLQHCATQCAAPKLFRMLK
jgi:hypothetical protein